MIDNTVIVQPPANTISFQFQKKTLCARLYYAGKLVKQVRTYVWIYTEKKFFKMPNWENDCDWKQAA